MRVRVKFVSTTRKKYGLTDFWLFLGDDATVEDVLARIEREHGVSINLEDTGVAVLVNGKRLEFIGGPKAKLRDLDEIVIMPIIAGGI
ncbi:MAG: MoaD/ThiS family protein [Candidatus Bathyarchaeia archaeon]